MSQRGLGVVVKEFARGHEVSRHQICGVAVQSCKLAPDFGCELLGLDLVGDVWACVARGGISIGRRLGTTRTVGPRSAWRRGALSLSSRTRWATAGATAGLTTLATCSVVDHFHLSLQPRASLRPAHTAAATLTGAHPTPAHPQGFCSVSCGVAMSSARRCSLISMGKLIYGFNVSVDGYIADAQGNIDWSDPSDELHQYWNDFERETALSFYGRRLYELMSAYWPTADEDPDATPLIVDFAHIWRDMPKVVFSRTLESVDWNSRLERGDPVEVVTKLKAETDGNLEVAGATLAAPIVQAGLVDEYRIVMAPTAVGGGTPFFPTLPSWIPLRLVENRTFPCGTILLRYEAKHD